MNRLEVARMSHHMLWWTVCVEILLCVLGESCLPSSFHATAPQEIDAGYVLGQVHVVDCVSQLKHAETSDSDFTIHPDGNIVALHSTKVPPNGRFFSVWAHGADGQQSKMVVFISQITSQTGILKRVKRRWSPPPIHIDENDNTGLPKDVELIGSDSSSMYSVYYVISGSGVDQDPVGVFSVERLTGMLRIHRAVDREEWPQFTILARVYDRVTNQETDEPLPLTVNVIDKNDNAPTFSGPLQFSVLEQNAGVIVGQVNATDRDEVGTDHTKIKYTLLDGKDLFSIDSQTGIIKTTTATLDREVKDKHLITVEIRDMNGAPTGLFNTATATVVLQDINDNPPVFTKSPLSANVKENVEGETLLLRIPVEDKDLPKSPNWKSVFVITKGNEAGHFRIDTDPNTNEGLLYLTKPLDYEKTKAVKLEVQGQNEAALSGTQASWVSAPIDVNVEDVDEGPEFMPANLALRIKEGLPNGTVISKYNAKDPETNSSVGIKYYAASDPASWIDVGENTGELKIANSVDRESHFVKNNMYNITVKAVDSSAKTGTGTVFITIDDMNDNIPLLPTHELIVCEKNGELGSVVVVAEDKDGAPYSSPFTFDLIEPNEAQWTLKKLNDTAAALQQVKELPTGIYLIPVLVKDQQGEGDTQTATVRICRCRNGQCLASQMSAALGVGGILAMLFGLALLLLLCVLAAFVCVTGKDKLQLDDATGSGGLLLKSNTEGPGEEGSTLVIVPSSAMQQSVLGAAGNSGVFGTVNTTSMAGGWQETEQPFLHQSTEMLELSSQYDFSGMNGAATDSAFLLNLQNQATLQTWRTNGIFLDMKLNYLATGEEGRYADDILHTYGFEGEGSVAGSVGCCSDQSPHDNLDFLNNLGPKFRTLAEVCNKN